MTVEAAPKDIPDAEKRKLWVRAGGRCQICNKYLLEDEFTQQPTSLAELAHNVGRQRAPGSPRGLADLPIEERNKAENLLLLCGDHHSVIDSMLTRGEYTVESLAALKLRQEERIRELTEIGEDAETVVLRVIGTIRGAPVELSKETVRRTVAAAMRYPRYDLAARGGDIELDLRQLPGEASAAYWSEAERQIEAMLVRLRDGVQRGSIRHLSVFPFARIPLLIKLGRELDDKVPVELYQKQRDRDETWEWDADASPVGFETTLTRSGVPDRVALVVSISGTVDMARLAAVVDDQATIYTIKPADGTLASPDIFRSRDSLDAFAACFRSCLASLERDHRGLDAIELFVAAPLTAAVAIGRACMTNVHPRLRVYDRDADGGYLLAMEVE